MRLRTYTAPTMSEAMALVREELGEEAIIVSTKRGAGGKGVCVTAARESIEPDDDLLASFAAEDIAPPPDIPDTLRQAMAFHGVPARLTERLVAAAVVLGGDDATLALAGAFDAAYVFSPLPTRGGGKPLMLVGPPGGGKTLSVAKLATRAKLAKLAVEVITTDTVRAGAVEQISAFTRILKAELKTADRAAALKKAVGAAQAKSVVLIDTPATNPFNDAEMDRLGSLIEAVSAEPILVLAAGGDALESAEIAAAFADVGATRLLATRLDMSRRLGGVLAAADAGRLRFSEVSVTAQVASGLSPINPVSLARLLVPQTAPPVAPRPSTPPKSKAKAKP